MLRPSKIREAANQSSLAGRIEFHTSEGHSHTRQEISAGGLHAMTRKERDACGEGRGLSLRCCPRPVRLQSHSRHSYSPNSQILSYGLSFWAAVVKRACGDFMERIIKQAASFKCRLEFGGSAADNTVDPFRSSQAVVVGFSAPFIPLLGKRGGRKRGTRRRPSRAPSGVCHCKLATVALLGVLALPAT